MAESDTFPPHRGGDSILDQSVSTAQYESMNGVFAIEGVTVLL